MMSYSEKTAFHKESVKYIESNVKDSRNPTFSTLLLLYSEYSFQMDPYIRTTYIMLRKMVQLVLLEPN